MVLLVEDGSLELQIEHRRFGLAPGQFIVVNARRACRLMASDTVRFVKVLVLSPISWHQWMGALPKEGETPFPFSEGKLEFCEQVYSSQDSHFGRRLLQTRLNVTVDEQEWKAALIQQQWKVYEQLQRLTSAKLSTRKELYRRLCMAKRYMVEHLDQPLDLDTLSQVACLSKFHFIRLFKEVYGQTPRQYLIARRLDRASLLLKQSDLSFHEICHEVGLKDASSFGRLFKRNFGATPHLYRRMYALG